MPLRASSLYRHELPIIIFVTDLDYIKNEWDMICTFPDIYILNVRISIVSSNSTTNKRFSISRVHPVIHTIFN